jgi:predicted permease
MFARLDARQHEMGIRLALGEGRIRMLMEMAAEGAVLGAVGAIGGIAFAWYATTAITTLLLQDYVVRTSLDAAPDRFVATVAGAAAIAVGISVATISALIVLRSRATTSVTVARRSVSRSRRVGRVMVAVQVALSLVLVAYASVLARSLQKLETRASGLTTDSVLVAYPQQRLGMYERTDATAYYTQALERLQDVPGVTAAAFSRARPQAGALPLQRVGITRDAAAGDAQAEIAAVSPGFFDALGIDILSGRAISVSDNPRTPRVAVISQTLEARLFGAGQGIGKQIRVSSDPEWEHTVVIGIARDASVFDVRGGNRSIVYTPALQTGSLAHFKYLVVRAPTGSSRDIERALESLGVEVLPSLQSLSYIRGRTILQERMLGALGGYFGLLGLLVVIVGLYGLLSYVLSLRRREFGVHMAIGATAAHVARLIFRDALTIAVSGMLLGLVVVFVSARLVARVLVETDPADPLAIAVACLAILAASSVAATIPALRAARIDPAREIRSE